MEYSFSSWNEETFVLAFSDEDCYDRMDQIDNNYGNREQIRRDSKRCYSSQITDDYAKLQLEDCYDSNYLRLDQENNEIQEKKLKYLSEDSRLPKHSPEQLPKICTDMEKDKIVNVSKLIYQLLNAKVVIEKIGESSEKDLMSGTKCLLPNQPQLKDSIQRYCPKCETLKADKHLISTRKSCPKCETILKYVCSKCNSMQYLYYKNLKLHWNKCTGQDADTCKKINPANYLVEKTQIDYSREIIRYCPICNIIKENCSKWNKKICRNCDHNLFFQCNKCKAQYKYSQSLMRHMQSECYPSHYKCNQCDFSNSCWDGMRHHVKYVHGGTKIDCPRCNSVLKNEFSLRRHSKYCRGEPKFRCDSCAFKTKNKCYLRTHMRKFHGK